MVEINYLIVSTNLNTVCCTVCCFNSSKLPFEAFKHSKTKYDIEYSKCIVYHLHQNTDSRLSIEYSKCIVYFSQQNLDSRLPLYKPIR